MTVADAFGISELNAMSEVDAYNKLLLCCGSRAWASSVVADRPFKDLAGVLFAAERAWQHATEEEKLEAFSHHPRIGDGKQLRERFAATATWAQEEQKGAQHASEQTLSELARLNAEYEKRFEHVFLICATGLTAEQMLSALRKRILNSAVDELALASSEQAKITRIRLEKMLK